MDITIARLTSQLERRDVLRFPALRGLRGLFAVRVHVIVSTISDSH